MLLYSEFGAEPRQITQRIRFYSWTCVLTSALALGVTLVGDFLVTNPISTLKSIGTLYVTVYSASWLCGWFVGTNQNTSKWTHDAKYDKKLWALCRFLIILLAGLLIIYLGFIIFGAPFTSSFSDTMHFALVVDIMTAVPGCLLLGSNYKNWLRIILGSGPQSNWEQTWLNTVCGCLAGAWFGAFVVPLDWDRPWQVWPVSCCYGSLTGYCLSHLYNLFMLRQKSSRRKHI